MNAAPASALELLEERCPGLRERISGAAADRARISSWRGLPFLEARGAGGWISLHSRHDPRGEAERLLEGVGLAESRFVVLLGFGAGYALEETLRRVPRDAQVVVIEPEPGILLKAAGMRDLSGPLRDERVMIFAGEKPAEVARRLDPVTWGLSFRQPCLVEHPAYEGFCGGYLAEMRRAIVELFEIEKTGVATRRAGQKAFNANIFRNLPRLARAPGVAELFGLFSGRPAVIASAGPSLGKQLPLLKELQGRAVIICVDTCMRALLAAGIKPDLVAAVDFTRVNFKHFEGVDTSELPVAAASIVYPPCLEAHKGPLFSLFNEYPVTDWLMPLLGNRGQVTIGDSTAHMAFHLAERMGCGPIILVGQDLAFTGGKTHAEGVATRAEAKGGETLMVDGWAGGRVATSPALMTILKHFEGKIAASAVEVINATEGGAHIAGARHIPFREAAREYCRRPFSAAGVIAAAAAREPRLDVGAFRAEAFFARRKAARARRLAHEGIRCIRRLISALCENATGAMGRDILELERLYADILSDGELLHLLQAGMELSLMQLRWPDPASGAPFKHDFLVELIKDRRFLNDLCASAKDFSRQLKESVRALGDDGGCASAQTDEWLRHAARLSCLKADK